VAGSRNQDYLAINSHRISVRKVLERSLRESSF
jgi:hypothetical protein